MQIKKLKGGITAAKGFLAAGIHSGIKPLPLLDLALIASIRESAIAGVFTKNRIIAAPIVLNQKKLKEQVGQAIIINSGNANAFTGKKGLADAEKMAKTTAMHLEIPSKKVFVGSTGIISKLLPISIICQSIPVLTKKLRRSGHLEAAHAILTTDTKPKEAAFQANIGQHLITIGGMAKGSGMIHPDMATMLAYLTTDAAIAPQALQIALRREVDQSFNCISVDGDTSPNDTVLCMANGTAGNSTIQLKTAEWMAFCSLLHETCLSLALQICHDGEGATKLVEIVIRGTNTTSIAKKIAQTVATSLLVKTALFGEDPNWGRIVAAIGRAGVPINPRKISISFNNVFVVKEGNIVGLAADKRAHKIMKGQAYKLNISFGKSKGFYRLWTTDLSYNYIKINASYSS